MGPDSHFKQWVVEFKCLGTAALGKTYYRTLTLNKGSIQFGPVQPYCPLWVSQICHIASALYNTAGNRNGLGLGLLELLELGLLGLGLGYDHTTRIGA